MADFSWLPITPRGNYIDGAFRMPSPAEGVIRDTNPGDPNDVIGEFPWRIDAVDEAVAAARRAFRPWAGLRLDDRAALLRRYAEALKKNKERIAQAISREMGKVLWEARQEVDLMVNKVAITLDDAMPLVKEERPPGVPGAIRYYPRGVLAVIGPFNFPGHLPNGHIVPALATGNTVVFKAASHNPGVAQLMAECVEEAGFPPGVFNVVQIPGRHGDRLVAHPDIDGVLFTGSTEIGMRIARICLEQHWKVSALEMGGKDPAIVLDDAPFDVALYEVLTGAFLTSGQRCTATSRVILERGIADRFAARLAEATRKLRAGLQHRDDTFMGPLADVPSAEAFEKWQAIAAEEGAETLVAGGAMREPPIAGGAYVRPSVHRVHRVDPSSRYQREELFAPDTCLYTVDSLDEAIALADDTEYGLAASIFTANKESFLQAARRIRAGVINWNKGTVGASSKLPFGGLKKSGNGHPAALWSVLYCTYPVATLEDESPSLPPKLYPGVEL
jgi:succinylglutamic semialdehyde dehydrogenase